MRRCHQTKATSTTTPIRIEPHVTAFPQLDIHAWLKPYTTKKQPAAREHGAHHVESRSMFAPSARDENADPDDAQPRRRRD